MEELNENLMKEENNTKEYQNNCIINEEKEEIEEIEEKKNYSLEQILNSPTCALSKEKEYIWKNSLFSPILYELLTTEDKDIHFRYDNIYKQIENILMGDFCNAKEKIIYYKDFFYISFLLNTNNNTNNTNNADYLLFVIYFSKTDKNKNSEYFSEYLEFLNISKIKSEIKKSLSEFSKDHIYSNADLEYDKQCLLDSNVFFSKTIKNNENKIIRYPYEYNIINKSDKIKNVEVMGVKVKDKGFIDIEKLIPKQTIINVLNIIRDKETLDYDLLFNNDIINIF